MPPVRAGRFFVYGAHDAGQVPHGVIPMKIEAGLAFGTGHHETTALCLAALSDLARTRRFRNVLDLGCGTGLLAIGAAKLWKRTVLASDIDPVAVDVTRENARANGAGALVLAVTADGLTSPLLANGAPYDLIIANILAGPLTQLAPAIQRRCSRGRRWCCRGFSPTRKSCDQFLPVAAAGCGAPRWTVERACAGETTVISCFDKLSMRSPKSSP